jgi:DNA-binding transcriptional ArsR family regulator
VARRATLTLGTKDWARSRFVRSLAWEIVQAMRAVTSARKQLHHASWLESIDRGAIAARLPVLFALNPASGWTPDFLAPPPRLADRSLEDELAEIGAYPPASVAADLQRCLDSNPTRSRHAAIEPLIADPVTALTLIVSELRWAWSELIAPFWPPVRELISADIAYRSSEIARVGLGQALVDLHDRVSVEDGAVVVAQSDDVSIDLAGAGLSMMPSAFVWPDVILVHDEPWPTTLVYPARGIGDLWNAPPTPSTGLAGVLGYTRALLLTDLAAPSTTTALAARHHLSPAAVSTQLARLRSAGLVTSHRLGKEVHYRRTRLADSLLHGG